jgi:DNA-binding transcriptional LysR family regulator
MPVMHTDAADLNLLVPLEHLLEERHISRAAEKAQITQPAMSRTLTRLRRVFDDELLVRVGRSYELTPRAIEIQRELATVMNGLRVLLRSQAFDPAVAEDVVRVHWTDYLTSVLFPALTGALFAAAPRMSLNSEPLSRGSTDDLERGRVDLVLTPIRPPAPLRWTSLFDERLVAVTAAGHTLDSPALTLDDLIRFPHASVSALGTEQMIVESRLAALGIPPQPGLRVPFFTAALAALPGTELIALLPNRLLERLSGPEVRVMEAPPEIAFFTYGMAWHPRLDADPLHRWMRALVRETCAGLR